MPRFGRFLWGKWWYNNDDRDREVAYWRLRFIQGCNSMANHNVDILVRYQEIRPTKLVKVNLF